MPDHSTFSKNRYGRFGESDIYRVLFEEIVEQCRQAGLVPGEGFTVDTDSCAIIQRCFVQKPMLSAGGCERANQRTEERAYERDYLSLKRASLFFDLWSLTLNVI